MEKNWSERWDELKEEQKKLLDRYEGIVEELASFDLIHENENLKKILHKQEQQIFEQAEKLKKITAENQSLRVALQEQILDEKLNILKISRNKLDTYFERESSRGENRLKALENETMKRIDELRKRAEQLLQEDKAEILRQLEQLSVQLQEAVNRQRENWVVEEKQLRDEIHDRYDRLSGEEITEETRQKRIKQNQIEMKIGLNWVNKIGIILILLGVGAASRYTYSTWFNDYMKGIAFFVLGALFLAGGEWFFRRGKTVFSNGLLGGGISVLYGAVFYSHFLLEIIDVVPALLISVLVTATAIVFSVRHHSRTICSLGLVGGYLPLISYIFAFGLSGNGFYGAMIYLFLLNLFVLLVSLWKRWNIVHILSFVFHMPAMFYLVFFAPSEAIGILYSLLAFLMYLLIVLAYPFKFRLNLKVTDVILLGLNTMISCVVIYLLIDEAGWNEFRGLLALIFSLVYLGLGQFIEKVMRQEKHTMVLFYATSLTFAVLMIPFQFGIQWASLGWLVEGLLLMIYGYRNKLKSMEMAGWGIFLLCIVTFYAVDVFLDKFWFNEYFHWKYFAVIAGMAVATGFYLRERKISPSFHRESFVGNKIDWFKYFTLVNIWIYLIYSGSELYNYLTPADFAHDSFYKPVITAVLTLTAAYAFRNIPLLYDRVVKWISLVLFIIADLVFLYVTAFVPVFKLDGSGIGMGIKGIEVLSLLVLIAFNIFVFVSFRRLLLDLLRETNRNIEWYPLVLGIFLWGNLTVLLAVQFELGDIGLLFSLLYLALAIGYIIYGFLRRYVYIRRMGLALALLSTSKLFLYDLSYLGAGGKIVAYFSFGVVLLGISFIYQRISNKLEERDHVQQDA